MKKILALAVSIIAFGCTPKSYEVAPELVKFSVVAPDTTIQAGSKIEFSAEISNEPTYIEWKVNGVVASNVAQLNSTFDKAGNYTIDFYAKNSTGEIKKSVKVIVMQYLGGFYVVNEGWYGHEMGSVNHYDPTTKKLTIKVNELGEKPAILGNTTCFGVQFSGNYYFVSKQANRLVKADAQTLFHKETLTEIGGDGRAFAGIDEKRGVVTTSKGAFALNLDPLTVGEKIGESVNQCGSVYVTKNHIFVIDQKNGIEAYSTTDYKLVKQYGKGSVGFAMDKDGNLWAAAKTVLLHINIKTLEMTETQLPAGVTVSDSWGSWNPGSLCSSMTENAILFTKSGMWGGGNQIYKYVIGDINSLTQPFASSTDEDDTFYGAGINIDPKSGDIVATFVKTGWGDNFKDNRLVIFDGKTGAEKVREQFNGFYFPTSIIFN